jgi:hypothetical protein
MLQYVNICYNIYKVLQHDTIIYDMKMRASNKTRRERNTIILYIVILGSI